MANNQQSFDLEPKKSGPVECLGMIFESDEARRAYFLERLKEKLQDPEFRKLPGFPKGTDEDILRLSDPPYYTACPNPFLGDFVRVYGRPYDLNEEYHREPFAVDVSIGKTDASYKAHGYHTKVPPRAIVPSVLHYTRPGDVILDAFCGSGMTGVGVQFCSEHSLIRDELLSPGTAGERTVILSDLSPVATFIAAGYNLKVDLKAFINAAERLLNEVEWEYRESYTTRHVEGNINGTINYTVWSDLFACPSCGHELVFYSAAYDRAANKVRDKFPCPQCGAELTKSSMDRVFTTSVDRGTGETISVPKRQPVLINYSVGKATYNKVPDSRDRVLLSEYEDRLLSSAIPRFPMMHSSTPSQSWGDKWRAGTASFTHVHHLYLPRQAAIIGNLWERASTVEDAPIRRALLFWLESHLINMSILNRYRPEVSFPYNPLSGVYYVGSLISEASPFIAYRNKLKRMIQALGPTGTWGTKCAVSTNSATSLLLPDNTIDYVFTDPPFGANFAYAELNFVTEAFHRVFTNTAPEAIISPFQKKGLQEYQTLMRASFEEYFRVLKPGRWITIVFSNSSNAVWRAIQESLGTAGFVVADVRTLDKQQLSFNQVSGVTVKQDLVISAYKPTEQLVARFDLEKGTEDSAWAFVEEHLGNVPLVLAEGTVSEVVAERTAQLLLDRMIAFHVQRGVAVPLDAGEFFRKLEERYPKRDGMYFLHSQVADYDRLRARVEKVKQLSFIVTDEASAILWVRADLERKPQSFQDLQPVFMREIQSWAGHEKTVELKEILEENFLFYDGTGPVPAQIHTYLSTNFKDMRGLSKDDPSLRSKALDRWYVPDPNKQSDLDQLRTKRLLKEFLEYRESKQKKLKQFRTEAIRAGFKAAYDQKDYRTIADVAKKLPEQVIQEDEKLLMYYDVALMRLGED